MVKKNSQITYVDDDHTPVKRLFALRIPSLVVGLFLGLFLSFMTSRFEEVLAKEVAVAFFIPFIVYLAAAVGSQTQTIYVRDLKTGQADFHTYLIKEAALGLILGLFFSIFTGLIVMAWFQSLDLALAVSLGVLGAVFVAPVIALVISEILELEHEDPAVWAGPMATVVQDTVSVLVFGSVATAILL